MADIPNRPDLEAELAQMITRLTAKQRRELMQLLGDPPNLGNVPMAFWEASETSLYSAVVPFLTMIYLDSAERLMVSLPIGVDWALINQRAAQWARNNGSQLIRLITENSRRSIREIIAAFFEEGQTRADLEKQLLARVYSPVRAEMIAVTEVTNAAMAGELSIAEELADQGVEMIAVWQTSNDERVCNICGPLHGRPADHYIGKRQPIWIHPENKREYTASAAHPRCRCWYNSELPKVRRRG